MNYKQPNFTSSPNTLPFPLPLNTTPLIPLSHETQTLLLLISNRRRLTQSSIGLIQVASIDDLKETQYSEMPIVDKMPVA